VSDADSHAYWAGWYDSWVAYGGLENMVLMVTCEGLDWYAQDIAMLAVLNAA
jgi:hypothetical protein